MPSIRVPDNALGLLEDQELQNAIRRRTPGAAEALAGLRKEQTKLLQAYYKDLIDDTLLASEQACIRLEIENLKYDAEAVAADAIESTELSARFEKVIQVLEQLNVGDLWPHATESERRTLLDELLQHVEVHPDRLTVAVHGAPPLNVAFSEVGLKDSGLSRVGGASSTPSTCDPWETWLAAA